MKRNIVIAAVAAAALIGGGTATAVAISDDGTAPTPTKPSSVRLSSDDDRVDDDRVDDGRVDDDRDEDVRAAGAAKVTAAEAVQAALKAQPGTATSAELDEDDDRLVWDVDVLGKDNTWYDITVDPGTGEVLGTHADDDGDEGARHVRAALKDTDTDLKAALDAALKSAPGTVTSIGMDDDGGDDAWNVEITGKDGTEHELDIALNGAKASPHHDDGADDDQDDHDDSDDHGAADDSDDDGDDD